MFRKLTLLLTILVLMAGASCEYYATYFKKCATLLKPQGMMLIQAITMADQRYEQAKRSVDFIQRYIFPAAACLLSASCWTT